MFLCFYKGGFAGDLLERSSTDNMAGEKLGNIFTIRNMWLWSNPDGKYFYLAFLEQRLDNSHYLLSLEIQLIQTHLSFLVLFLLWWMRRGICPPKPNLSFCLVLHQNICVRLIDPRCPAVAKLGRLEGSQSFMWTFYADLVMLIPFFFFPLTLALKERLLLQLESCGTGRGWLHRRKPQIY